MKHQQGLINIIIFQKTASSERLLFETDQLRSQIEMQKTNDPFTKKLKETIMKNLLNKVWL